MDQVTERIWIGDQADAQNRGAVLAAGIRAVVNATRQTDNLTGDPAFAYLRLDHDDGVPWPAEKLRGFLAFMERVTAERRAVLIHCGAGISRASSLFIAWLLRCGFGWEEAEELARARRPQINPNPALKESILAYFGSDPTIRP